MDSINDSTDSLINNYKNLLVNYEKTRQLYEAIIKEYENDMDTTIVSKCSRLVCYNSTFDSVIWRIYSTSSGILLYESAPHLKNETLTLELQKIITSDTEFIVKASKSTGQFNCQYIVGSNTTGYYNSGSDLQYIGTVPLEYVINTVQYLNCSKISYYNNADSISKFIMYTLDGAIIYESENISTGGSLIIDLVDLNIQSYTVFKVKTILLDGSETIADITLEYVINSIYQSEFYFSGTAARNELMYLGVSPVTINENIKKCAAIVGYTLIGDETKWQLLALDDTIIYTSGGYFQYETWTCDLSTFNFESGYQFRLKSINEARKDVVSEQILEYYSNAETVYFQSDYYNLEAKLYFNGYVPTCTTPPILKCSKVIANHTQYPVIMRWAILNESGSEIYKSDRCKKGSSSTINLSSLNIAAGTRVKVKASVTAGADSIAYILLEYDPASVVTAYVGFYGNSFITIVPYKGFKVI